VRRHAVSRFALGALFGEVESGLDQFRSIDVIHAEFGDGADEPEKVCRET
jgi:hypothetical protein